MGETVLPTPLSTTTAPDLVNTGVTFGAGRVFMVSWSCRVVINNGIQLNHSVRDVMLVLCWSGFKISRRFVLDLIILPPVGAHLFLQAEVTDMQESIHAKR